MPTYEFLCGQGHRTNEYLQISKVVDELECRMCREPAKRQIGAGAPPIFKGPGFHSVDYPKKPKGPTP